jgi:hypothetical protein
MALHTGVQRGGALCSVRGVCRAIVELYSLFFDRDHSALGLQLQRDVLRSVLTVSFIVFLFFALRAFAFTFYYLDDS